MLQIEFLRQLWRNCLRQSWLEEVLHTASTDKTVVISVNPKHKPLQKVEYRENDLLTISFEEKLRANLVKWAQTSLCVTSSIDKQQFYKDVYALFGNIALKPEVLEYTIQRTSREKADLKVLYDKLEDFYRRWCDGEFIAAAPDKN